MTEREFVKAIMDGELRFPFSVSVLLSDSSTPIHIRDRDGKSVRKFESDAEAETFMEETKRLLAMFRDIRHRQN